MDTEHNQTQTTDGSVADQAPSMAAAPDPVVNPSGAYEVARDVLVIPNQGVELVPNIAVIGGTESVLVVDTGMGPENARKVLDLARDYARGRRMYLTTTHFHPEHAFGAATFAGEATYLVNRSQAVDLEHKVAPYLGMFRGLGPNVARQLEGVELPVPDVVFDDAYDLDLGDRNVEFRATGRGHTKGDQVVKVADVDVLFAGDLVETGQFAIFPWFPPHDTDVSGLGWISVMDRLVEKAPAVVVPGHGTVGDSSLLSDVRDYLDILRDETWRRRDSGMGEEEIIGEVTEALTRTHPEWHGREWIATGVGCFCAEHPSAADEGDRARSGRSTPAKTR